MKMSEKITIYTRSTGKVLAEISLDKNPQTAKAILAALPIFGKVNKWGDEIYFRIQVSLPEEKAQQEVEIGDLGYWPQGNGFCIFFGRTPASTGPKPRAASPVNVFGKVLGDATVFKETQTGEEIRIARNKIKPNKYTLLPFFYFSYSALFLSVKPPILPATSNSILYPLRVILKGD